MHTLYLHITIIVTELRFGFNMSEYTVNEANGSVEVCVTLQEGVISDTAVLPFRINTQQVESAKGRCIYMYVYIRIIYISKVVHLRIMQNS